MKLIILLMVLLPFTSLASIPQGMFGRFVITLDEEKLLFHWTPKEKVFQRTEYNEITPEAVISYAKATTSYNQEESPRNGLYFALDPVSTRDYSDIYNDLGFRNNESWLLLMLRVSKGQKLINFNSNEQNLNQDEKDWLQSFGCTIAHVSDIVSESLPSQIADSCGKAMKEIIKSTEAIGVIYPYYQALLKGCKAHNKRDFRMSAIILKDIGSLNERSLNFFDVHSKPLSTNNDMLLFIQGFWRSDLYKNKGSTSYNFNSTPWDISQKVNTSQTNKFANDYFLGCRKI